jgi:alkanesulfonate monooxygenase SsuD/methylene tetrahydromethanopterin reductase-like flavin-dependent oxidoreductase (luciferase family)
VQFCQQLSAYLSSKEYTGYQLYQDMFEQAVLSDQCGYDSVALTEHHLINILMMPAPLQFAVKIAAATKNIKIITAVGVLPIHDMRIYAGEVIATQMFTDDRLILGVGRGAFACEMALLGSPLEESRDKFNESLEVLTALFSKEEVSWKGDFYNFDSLTAMPRPMTKNGPPIMMAVLNPEGIYACTKRGFHIMTTPLAGNHQLMLDQVDGFNRAKTEIGDDGKGLTLSLSRGAFIGVGSLRCRFRFPRRLPIRCFRRLYKGRLFKVLSEREPCSVPGLRPASSMGHGFHGRGVPEAESWPGALRCGRASPLRRWEAPLLHRDSGAGRY